MHVLILPTESDRLDSVLSVLGEKGHSGIVPDKKNFFVELPRSDVVLAMGKLTPLGIWFWGYCYSRKRVRVMKGVDPCFVSRKLVLDKWLESIPIQMSLFPISGETL
jgi:hypothetical protein